MIEFAVPTATGVSAEIFIGTGFSAKVLKFIIAKVTGGDGSAADTVQSHGIATSSSSQRVTCTSVDDGGGGGAVYQEDARCIILIAPDASYLFRAALNSITTDGFTLNVATTDGNAYRCIAVCYGGSDITDAACFTAAVKTSNGTQDITTGIGFEPDFCEFFAGPLGTDAVSVGVAHGRPFRGWATASGQGLVANMEANGSVNEARYQRTSKCAGQTEIDGPDWEAEFSAFISTGITLNYTTTNGNAYAFYGLAVKGGQWAVVNDTQKTSTGTQATTTSFEPVGVELMSFNNVASSTFEASSRRSTGAASSTSARACHWTGSLQSGGAKTADHDHDSAAVLKMMTEGTPTVDAEADLSAFAATSFTLNWTTADGTARQFVALVAGSEGGAPAATSLVPNARRAQKVMLTR